jgi:hypothetical protein
MASDHNQVSGGPPARSGKGSASNRSGYGPLAKRISAITTNCLLTAVVLVAGLGFGRQVLRWWAEETAESADALRSADLADGLGDPSRLHVLQFGDQSWSLRRQSIAGGRQAAAETLRAVCREVLRQNRLPGEGPGGAEEGFLRQLAARDPVEQEPGKWRLYELDESLPMMVGTQPEAAVVDSSAGQNLAAGGQRVVVWGLALPAGPEMWTLFSFQPEILASQPVGPVPELPLPPASRRIVSMRVAGGGAMLIFEGPQEPKTWIDFYDGWFGSHNWKRSGVWQRFGARWHARYTAPGQGSGGAVDVHFGGDVPGRSSGLLLVFPSPSGGGLG